jgi:hypothetical protein
VVRAGLPVEEPDFADDATRSHPAEHDGLAQRLVDDLDLAVLDEEEAARGAALVEEEVSGSRLRDLGHRDEARQLLVVEVRDELTRPGFRPPDSGHAHAPLCRGGGMIACRLALTGRAQ